VQQALEERRVAGRAIRLGQQGGGAPEQRVAGAVPPVKGARQAPDGNWYVSDPKRPGKYLKVG
jgi:hypothetical protein